MLQESDVSFADPNSGQDTEQRAPIGRVYPPIMSHV